MEFTTQELETLGRKVGERVMDYVIDYTTTGLLLHSTPYALGSPGIVHNEAVAKATPCRCIEYRPNKKLCFSKGIIGALSDEQEKLYCQPEEKLVSPGLEKRLGKWVEAVGTCKREIEPIPRGERLEPWLSCMSRELAARTVEV